MKITETETIELCIEAVYHKDTSFWYNTIIVKPKGRLWETESNQTSIYSVNRLMTRFSMIWTPRSLDNDSCRTPYQQHLQKLHWCWITISTLWELQYGFYSICHGKIIWNHSHLWMPWCTLDCVNIDYCSELYSYCDYFSFLQ